jgi:hypothetical protein
MYAVQLTEDDHVLVSYERWPAIALRGILLPFFPNHLVHRYMYILQYMIDTQPQTREYTWSGDPHSLAGVQR